MKLRILVPILSVLVFAAPARATQSWAPTGSSLLSTTGTFSSGTETMTQPAAYNPATTYAAQAQAIYNGIPWLSLQNSNVGHKPCEACTTGADGRSGDAWWVPVGLPLDVASNLTLTICAGGNGTPTITTAGKIDLWYWSPIVSKWSKTTISISPGTGTLCSSSSGDSPGWGLPLVQHRAGSRLAALPNGVATTGGDSSMTITMEASNSSGGAL